MSMSEKLFGGLFFFLCAPMLLILAPTGLSFGVVSLVSLGYTLRYIVTTRHRCNSCGHIFTFRLKDYIALAKSRFCCPHCKKKKRWSSLSHY